MRRNKRTLMVGQLYVAGRAFLALGYSRMSLTEIYDELEDLQSSDPLFPPDANATSGLEVVPVHDHMNEEVERDGYPRDSGKTDELGVAEERSGSVVICM